MRQFYSLLGILLYITVPALSQGQRQAKTALAPTANRPLGPVSRAIDIIRPSVVQITCTFEFKAMGGDHQLHVQTIQSSGSGFQIDKEGHVATASHIVNAKTLSVELTNTLHLQQAIDPASTRVYDLHVSFAVDNFEAPNDMQVVGNFVEVGATVLQDSPTQDIAILALRVNPFKQELPSGFAFRKQPVHPIKVALPTFSFDRPADGEMVSVSGFPLDIPVLVTNTGWIASAWYMYPQPENSLRRYLGDVQVNPGNSGGPVYRVADGSVIGMVAAFKNEVHGLNSGLAIFAPIKEVFKLLQPATH